MPAASTSRAMAKSYAVTSEILRPSRLSAVNCGTVMREEGMKVGRSFGEILLRGLRRSLANEPIPFHWQRRIGTVYCDCHPMG